MEMNSKPERIILSHPLALLNQITNNNQNFFRILMLNLQYVFLLIKCTFCIFRVDFVHLIFPDTLSWHKGIYANIPTSNCPHTVHFISMSFTFQKRTQFKMNFPNSYCVKIAMICVVILTAIFWVNWIYEAQ